MRQKRKRATRRRTRDVDDARTGGGEPLADWVLRTETGWGMPHAWVALLAAFVVIVRALPSAAERMAAAWTRLRG